jgi:hypothetical protein
MLRQGHLVLQKTSTGAAVMVKSLAVCTLSGVTQSWKSGSTLDPSTAPHPAHGDAMCGGDRPSHSNLTEQQYCKLALLLLMQHVNRCQR